MTMCKAHSQTIKHVLCNNPQAGHPLMKADQVGPEIAEAWYKYFSWGTVSLIKPLWTFYC